MRLAACKSDRHNPTHQYPHSICFVLEILPVCETCQGWPMHARASLNLFTAISIANTGSGSIFNLQIIHISKILANPCRLLKRFSTIFAKMTKKRQSSALLMRLLHRSFWTCLTQAFMCFREHPGGHVPDAPGCQDVIAGLVLVLSWSCHGYVQVVTCTGIWFQDDGSSAWETRCNDCFSWVIFHSTFCRPCQKLEDSNGQTRQHQARPAR